MASTRRRVMCVIRELAVTHALHEHRRIFGAIREAARSMRFGKSLGLATVVAVFMMAAILGAHAAGWSSMVAVREANVVVVGTEANQVRAYDAQTEALVWSHPLEAATSAYIFKHGDAVVIVSQRDLDVSKIPEAKRDPGFFVQMIDARSGALRWSCDGRGLVAEPAIHGERLFISYTTRYAASNGHFLALDLSNGHRLWEMNAEVLGQFDGGDAGVETLYLALSAHASTSAPERAAIELQALDPATGKVRWTSATIEGEYNVGPQIAEGMLVVTTRTADGTPRYSGVRRSDGQIAWTLDFPPAKFDEVKLLGFTLYTRSEDGKRITVYNPDRGTPRWSVRPAQVEAPKAQLQAAVEGDGGLYTVAAVPSPGAHFTVLAYDLLDGHEVMHADVAGQLESPLRFLRHGLLLGAQQDGHHRLLCFDNALKPMWTADLDAALGDAPVYELTSNLVVQTDSQLLSFDLKGGHQRWTIDADITAGPVFFPVKNTLLYGDGDLNLVLRNLDDIQKRVAVTTRAWLNPDKVPNLIFVSIIVFLILFFIAQARKGRPLFIRRLAGLNALDDAVGRATEMGKPVLYVNGTQDVDEIQTLAGLSILGHVARRTAEYETHLLVPCSRSVVMSTAQEVVREAHYKAGRPDSYQQENVRYLTDDQFGFVAGVDGIMMRERPAANFYMGMFFGESLILAETGHATGAIQIAGTAEATQLPFFVAACDYTLIGEELYAASAYLSKNPMEVGSLKGQDYAKALIMAVIIVACALFPWWPQVKVFLSK